MNEEFSGIIYTIRTPKMGSFESVKIQEFEFDMVQIHKEFLLLSLGANFFVIFKFGAVVVWKDCMNNKKNNDQVFEITKKMLDIKEINENSYYEYIISDKHSFEVKDDKILLSFDNLHSSIIASSYAIAFSEGIYILEEKVQYFHDRIIYICDSLANKGIIRSTEKDLTKDLASLFKSRFNANSFSFVPKFISEEDLGGNMSLMYHKVSKDLETEVRTIKLESKMNALTTFYEIIISRLVSSKSHKIEVLIGIMIFIEVVIGIMHFLV